VLCNVVQNNILAKKKGVSFPVIVKKLKGGIRPMVKFRDLTELKVTDLWKEVKTKEEWRGDIDERISGMV
jgi:hypothetical protein